MVSHDEWCWRSSFRNVGGGTLRSLGRRCRGRLATVGRDELGPHEAGQQRTYLLDVGKRATRYMGGRLVRYAASPRSADSPLGRDAVVKSRERINGNVDGCLWERSK